METIATYWEKKIKIYGISESSELNLIRIESPVECLSTWGKHLSELEQYCNRFKMVSSQEATPGRFLIDLLLAHRESRVIFPKMKQIANKFEKTELFHFQGVAAVYFHGPHFQERFGITHTLEQALAPLQITPLCLGCSGTSIYIVILEQDKNAVISKVKETFLVPGN